MEIEIINNIFLSLMFIVVIISLISCIIHSKDKELTEITFIIKNKK